MGYKSDRAWSDQFVPRLRTLIGPYLLVPSTLEQDTKEAADLVVLRGRDLTIACRVRRHGFAADYPNQFTLRSKRDSGVMTEFRKIVYGWGDWMFYGHATNGDAGICPWWLIDLSSFRAHLIQEVYRKKLRQGAKSNNGDGTHFQWFDITSFTGEPPLLIAQSEPEAKPAPAMPAPQAMAAPTPKPMACLHKPQFREADGSCWVCKKTGAA